MNEALTAFLEHPLVDSTAAQLLAQARTALEAAGWLVAAVATSKPLPGTWPSRTWTTRLVEKDGPEDLWLDVRVEFHPSKAGAGVSQRWTLLARWDTTRLMAGMTALNSAYLTLHGGLQEQVAQLVAALEAETEREATWAADATKGVVATLAQRLTP